MLQTSRELSSSRQMRWKRFCNFGYFRKSDKFTRQQHHIIMECKNSKIEQNQFQKLMASLSLPDQQTHVFWPVLDWPESLLNRKSVKSSLLVPDFFSDILSNTKRAWKLSVNFCSIDSRTRPQNSISNPKSTVQSTHSAFTIKNKRKRTINQESRKNQFTETCLGLGISRICTWK